MRKLFTLILLFILGCSVSASVFSLNYDINFPIFDDRVNRIFVDNLTNKIYVGGAFKNLRAYTGSSALFNLNNYKLIYPWPKIKGQVYSIISDNNGGWYIGGQFNTVDDFEIKNLVHIFSDGSIDRNFRFEPSGYVNSLLLVSSTLYVGGSFDKINDKDYANLAAIDVINNSLIDWNPRVDGVIFSMAVSPSTLYVGGLFSYVGSEPRYGLAAFDLNSRSLLNWQPRLEGSLATVYSLLVSSSTLYVGGSFEGIDDQPRKSLAAFDINNNTLLDWQPRVETFVGDNLAGEVYSMDISDNRLYFYGYFGAVNDQRRDNLAAVDAQTGELSSWQPDKRLIILLTYGSVKISDQNVYVGGSFLLEDEFDRNFLKQNFAVFDKNSGGFKDSFDFDGEIYTIAINNSKIYFGGYFDTVIREKRKYLAVFSQDGNLLTTNLNVDGEMFGEVYAIKKFADKIFISGKHDFDSRFQSPPTVYFLKIFDSDNNEIGYYETNGPIYDLTVVSSTVYLGGDFSLINGRSVNDLAALDINTNTLLDNDPLNLVSTTSANSSEYISILKNEPPYLFIGGYFSQIGSYRLGYNSHYRLVAFKLVDENIDSLKDIIADGEINSLVFTTSTIYIGGYFKRIAGNNKNYLAVFDINDQGFISLSSKLDSFVPDGCVKDMKIISDILYFGGCFNNISGKPRTKIAAIDLKIEKLLSWNYSFNTSSSIINSFDNDQFALYVGGNLWINDMNLPANILRFDKLIPPQLSSIKLNNTYDNNSTLPANTSQVILTFNTDKPAICRYATTSNIDFDAMVNNINTSDGLSHLTTFSNLQGNATYIYYLKCRAQNNSDLKNREDYIVNFVIQASSQEISSGGRGGTGGGFSSGGDGYRSATTTSTTISQDNEALRLFLLQLILQLLSQRLSLSQDKIQLSNQSLPSSIPQNYQFTKILTPGSRGLDVAYLQIFFRQQGEGIKITGVFDEETKKAVIRFQEKYKDEILTPQGLTKGTGRVSTYTLKKINAILEGKVLAQRNNKINNLQLFQKSQIANVATATNITKTTSTENMDLNMVTNTSVFRTSSPLSSQEQTGILSIIQQFLLQQTALISNQSLPSSIPQNYQFTKILTPGSRGLDVAYLQIFFRQQGEGIKITGVFDEETKKAVIRFQEKYKDEILTPQGLTKGTGRVDAYTLRKINQMLKF